ncbi:MAG: ParA family protein, partial [bacterium]|nr:ParA family protein [bacterium]
MTREQIRDAIRKNLREAGMHEEDLRIQPDGFGGWLMAVVSEGFRGLSMPRRKEIALRGLEEVDFEWLDLLTPEEKQWSGALPKDSALETLPLWPEALARYGTSFEQPIFPSDLDEDLTKPIVATFYSLRGGVGRSSALA